MSRGLPNRTPRNVSGAAQGRVQVLVFALIWASSSWALGCGSKGELLIGQNSLVGGSGGTDPGGSAGLAQVAGLPEGGTAGSEAGGSGGTSGGAGGEGGAVCATDAPAVPSPVHRYSFDGAGGAVTDSINGADGKLVPVTGGTFDGKGTLTLDGKTGYVDLPNHLINPYTDVTIMAWTSWPKGGSGFTRIFDFGTSTVGEDPVGDSRGVSYIMASPFTGWAAGGNLGVEVGTPGTGIVQLPTPKSIKDTTVHQVTVVFRSLARVELYLDAKLLNTVAIAKGKLGEIDDVNNWLGRSQTFADNRYTGSYSEFRIYNQALDECAIATTLAAGPDAP